MSLREELAEAKKTKDELTDQIKWTETRIEEQQEMINKFSLARSGLTNVYPLA
jgi:predicted nuclease with TOPRIM domain